MKRYLIKKSLTGFLTIMFSFILTFFLIRKAPGNPIITKLGRENTNQNQIEILTKKYGLDENLGIQFYKYASGVVGGDLGTSIKANKPVIKVISEKLVPTIILSLTASVFSVLIGTFLGMYSAKKNNSFIDKVLIKTSFVVDSIPVFWLALMLIVLFATKLRLLPTSGMYSIRESYEGFEKFIDLLRHMMLPIATIVIVRVPYYFRISRTAITSVMHDDFVKTLRASGVEESKIFNKYIMRNAIIPIITAFSMSLATVIAGVAMVEIVFAWPGMGRVLMDAIEARDYPVISGLYLIISISVTFFMLVTDLIYVAIDPRIKLND